MPQRDNNSLLGSKQMLYGRLSLYPLPGLCCEGIRLEPTRVETMPPAQAEIDGRDGKLG
jgi:hypothetical protein